MPNIYLRLPISRCQFYRHRNADAPLMPHEPVRFSEYTEEHYVLRNSIYNKVLAQKVNENCFSQSEWRNMMNGLPPLGGKKVINRDRSQWLSYEEINQLNGEKMCHKTNAYDYLCIKLPNEVFFNDAVRQVTPSWSMDSHGIQTLSKIINNDFKRTLIDWVLATFDYCTDNGEIIMRSQPAMLERFLMRYGIEPTLDEKNNIRRIANRWIKTEQHNHEAYSCLDMRFRDSKEYKVKIKSILFT